MSRTAQLIVGALTDFVLTALTAVLAIGHFPDAWGWFVAVAGGIIASVKHVRGMSMDLKPLAALLALALAVSGCAAVAGYAGQHPGRIACKGKGVLAFQGGPYAGTIQGDCGDGFSYEQGPPAKP